MLDLARGWRLNVNRGPDWLIVKLLPPDGPGRDELPLAERLWTVMQQHFTYRLVLEMDQVTRLQSYLIGQLVALSERIRREGGLMRVCGLSPENQASLEACRPDAWFPHFANRGEAVMGHRPHQPR